MSAIYILVGLSLVVASGFLVAFIWAVRQGQYDDPYTPSIRMLFDQGSGDASLDASDPNRNTPSSSSNQSSEN